MLQSQSQENRSLTKQHIQTECFAELNRTLSHNDPKGLEYYIKELTEVFSYALLCYKDYFGSRVGTFASEGLGAIHQFTGNQIKHVSARDAPSPLPTCPKATHPAGIFFDLLSGKICYPEPFYAVMLHQMKK